MQLTFTYLHPGFPIFAFVMKNIFLTAAILMAIIVSLCCTLKSKTDQNTTAIRDTSVTEDTIYYSAEKHLKNVRQLTYGGDNAEGYFSFDDKMIVFQRRNANENIPCDQIYYGNLPKDNSRFEYKLLSTGKGRTTCSYFLPGDDKILYASTHEKVDTCLPDPDRSKGYLWGVYDSYEIYYADLNGNILQQLTDNNFYDAEATVSPKKR